jgi:hypothetical protein
MPIRKVPISWQTGVGGSGVSVFYSEFGSDPTVALALFINTIRIYFPPVVTWTIPSSGDVVDVTTGQITGAWTGGTAASNTGTGAAPYVAGTGAFVRWATGSIVNGRRVKGRTFLCPLITTAFDAAGTLADTTVTAMNAAVATLVSTSDLVIWHRPSTIPGTDGAECPVLSGQVGDVVTSLRSRRK